MFFYIILILYICNVNFNEYGKGKIYTAANRY